MIFVDTHTHLYLEDFDADRDQVIADAIARGVDYFLLPNVDATTTAAMLALCTNYPRHCYPMMGLHPASVKQDYEEQLQQTKNLLATGKYIAIGEIGMDLYWDKTFVEEQKCVLSEQLRLAVSMQLPVVIHSRNSFDEILSVIQQTALSGLTGVFHCFSGTIQQAGQVIGMGFKIGIGGVLTFKNSGLDKVVQHFGLEHLLLETDSPYLAPVPYRGKRNQSAYIPLIAQKIADIKDVSLQQVAEVTTFNAMDLFKLT
jgi:TatD DNase family protein